MKFDLTADPFSHLDRLVQEAQKAGLKDPNGMALATVSGDAQPSVRIVLYKGLIRGGLSFYTNYQGRKARELDINAKVSACFYWPTRDTQVRVEGVAAKLTRAESEAYFKTRPRLSQLGAWASQQSQELSSMAELEARIAEMDKRFNGMDVPCPPHWGGYHIVPHAFEFWFAHEGRLHERYVYEKKSDAKTWRTYMRFP